MNIASAQTDINTKIDGILQARRQKLPVIEKEITRWNDLQQNLQTLAGAVSDLRQHDKTAAETRLNLAGLHFDPVQEAIASTLSSLGVLKGRLMRDTLNIGVSGRAINPVFQHFQRFQQAHEVP